MDDEASLARTLRVTTNDYDTACKQILSEKQVLSRILHDWILGFDSVSPARIEHECFAGAPRIGADPLDRNEPPGKISALTNEDGTLLEGTTFFDVRFEAKEPATDQGENLVHVEVDVEAQNDFYPGYPLIKRGIFYVGRLLSLQGEDVISESHYERVRKAVSVWVCAHPPRKYAGTVTRLSLKPTNIVGNARFNPKDYGLIELVMACLDDRNPGSSPGALGMLEVLLARGMEAETKLKFISEQCGIVITKPLSKKVSGMCNLGIGILEEGRKEGRKDGRDQERAKFLEVAAQLVRDGRLALEEATQRFGFSESELRAAL